MFHLYLKTKSVVFHCTLHNEDSHNIKIMNVNVTTPTVCLMGEKFCYVATVKLQVLGSKQFNDGRKVKKLYPHFKSTWLPFSDLSGCVSECC